MSKKRFTLTAFIVLMILAFAVTTVGAQDGGTGLSCAFGSCQGSGTGEAQEVQVGGLAIPEESAGVGVDGMGRSVVYNLNGGYTTAGVALRNNGSGTITLTGIPKEAKVYKAFLYWNIVDLVKTERQKKLLLNGVSVTGTFIGVTNQPCWIESYGGSFSYRADVTSLISGNGSYTVSKVVSGTKTGVDPWNSGGVRPLAEGASLVVIYERSTYPLTQVFIWDGAAYSEYDINPYIYIGPFTAATNPVGPVKTTSIVADGQNNAAGPMVTINYVEIPNSGMEGYDPKKGGGYFYYGNLWDTRTFNIGSMVPPGSTMVRVGLKASNDCVVWEAQVLSISSGTVDTDGDALLDGWEANGWMGVDLPAMGANPFHKDIFVENDWMPGHKPSNAVLETIRQSFAEAPVNNPDGINGINLHSDIGQGGAFTGGNEVPYRENWDLSGCQSADIWAAFDSYKAAYFNSNRLDIFHYMIWSHNQCAGNSSSGLARGIPASDFIVSLGLWPNYGTDLERQGTYMHELGHNLGLTHGGYTDDHVNYKPNHLSIMNYAFQVIGVWRDGARRWDYQRIAVDALNETALNETIGLTKSGTSLTNYGTRYYCPSGSYVEDLTTASIDWNCNGSATNTSVAVDINHDGSKNTLHSTQNQWKALIYNGGSIGGIGAISISSADEVFELEPCLKYEDVH